MLDNGLFVCEAYIRKWGEKNGKTALY